MTIFMRACLMFGFLALTACGAPKGLEVLPDLDLTQEGEERPGANEVSPNADVLGQFVEPSEDLSTFALPPKYRHLDPQKQIPPGLLSRAVAYFEANSRLIRNKNYLAVVDFAAHSAYKRFFIVNINTGAIWALNVAHGEGSDANNNGLLNTVSNVEGSRQSSRGYAVTAETYYGKYGRSLRMDGLSDTNSNMRDRAVVIHGSNYVHDREVQQGRSWGCLAVPMGQKERLVDLLAGGALIYSGISPENWTNIR